MQNTVEENHNVSTAASERVSHFENPIVKAERAALAPIIVISSPGSKGASEALSRKLNEPEDGRQPLPTEEPAVSAAIDFSVQASPEISASVSEEVIHMDTSKLKVHPLNAKIYGNEEIDNELRNSISKLGIIEALIVSEDGDVLAGNTRFSIAQELKLATVPVRVYRGADDLAQKELLIASNRQREKTTEQKIREYRLLREIEAEKAKRRQATNRGVDQPRQNFAQGESGKTRDITAAKLDMSGVSAEDGLKVVEAIDKLVADGKSKEAQELRLALNKSINGAKALAYEKEYLKKPEPKAKNARSTASKAAPATSPTEPPTAATSSPAVQPPSPAVASKYNNETKLAIDPKEVIPAHAQEDARPLHEQAIEEADALYTSLKSILAGMLTTNQRKDLRNALLPIRDWANKL